MARTPAQPHARPRPGRASADSAAAPAGGAGDASACQPGPGPPVDRLDVAAYTVPTEGPEADGTLVWRSTTMVVVELHAEGIHSLGYSYAPAAAGSIVEDLLAPAVLGRAAFDVPAAWQAMAREVRNAGRPGVCSMAMAAVDAALWDLKARLFGVPLASLFGRVRSAVPAYASGGFTNLGPNELREHVARWVDAGFTMGKLKIGTDLADDMLRVDAARREAGDDFVLMVDANGALDRKEALAIAPRLAEHGVTWFEEPVTSDDLEGLRLVRDRAPVGIEVAAGEYGFDTHYFRRMLGAGAVDVLQPDATRCGGFTGFIQAAALCDAHALPASAHTAPSLHAHLCCSLPSVRHVEHFHDHARIERMLLEGVPEPVGGRLEPDLRRPGMGLELRHADAEPFLVGSATVAARTGSRPGARATASAEHTSWRHH